MPGKKQPSARRVRKAAHHLSRLEREVFALSALGDLSIEDVSKRVGITPGRAERILARAIVKLGKAIEGRRGWWMRLW